MLKQNFKLRKIYFFGISYVIFYTVYRNIQSSYKNITIFLYESEVYLEPYKIYDEAPL